MGFYLRKSLKVGPFRLNLSKSGLGISAGVTGFRVGSGPRGSYVHMGRGGLYYRERLGDGANGRQAASLPATARLDPIDSEIVSKMVAADSRELVEELHGIRTGSRDWIWIIAVAIVAALALLVGGAPGLAGLAVAAVGLAAAFARRRSIVKQCVVRMYDLDEEARETFERLQRAHSALGQGGRVWHVPTMRSGVERLDAENDLRRDPISLRWAAPSGLRTNVQVPRIPVGEQTLHLLPECILVCGADGVGAVSYRDLDTQVADVEVVEPPPSNWRVAIRSRTWRHVTKAGRPDRRYKHNSEAVVAVYAGVRLSSKSGLDELLLCSNRGAAVAFAEALRGLRR